MNPGASPGGGGSCNFPQTFVDQTPAYDKKRRRKRRRSLISKKGKPVYL